MKVKLKYPWFSPSVSKRLNEIQSRSGRYYVRGVHILPDELFTFLPTSAEVLEAPLVLPDLEEGEGPTLEIGEDDEREGDVLPPSLRGQAAAIKADNEVAKNAKSDADESRLAKQQADIDRAARKANFSRKRAAKAKADEKAAASRDTKESAK